MPDYDGPERRKTTLAQLLAMQKSMEDLSREVGRLTGELETVNEVSSRQDTAEASTQEARRRQRRTNGLLIGVLAVMILVLGGLGGLAANAWISGHNVSSQFNTFRQESINNCQTRNIQAVGTKNLISLFLTLVPDDDKPSDVKLHQGLSDFEKTIPGPIDCNKLR